LTHILKCLDLRKKYGRREVVKGANVEVNSGEIVGLLGPNGAGKTTIFRMILGLVIPSSGSILLDDQEITHTPIHLRALQGITYLPQELSVFNGVRVEENIQIVLENLKVPPKRIKEKTQALLEEFGISNLARQGTDTLSGGEKRRLELARMMTLDPKFILLDEPFSGIDPMTVKDIQKLSISLRNRGMGLIVTDHNIEDIRKIVDRIYVIHKGEVLSQGPPEEVLNNPLVIEHFLGV